MMSRPELRIVAIPTMITAHARLLFDFRTCSNSSSFGFMPSTEHWTCEGVKHSIWKRSVVPVQRAGLKAVNHRAADCARPPQDLQNAGRSPARASLPYAGFRNEQFAIGQRSKAGRSKCFLLLGFERFALDTRTIWFVLHRLGWIAHVMRILSTPS